MSEFDLTKHPISKSLGKIVNKAKSVTSRKPKKKSHKRRIGDGKGSGWTEKGI